MLSVTFVDEFIAMGHVAKVNASHPIANFHLKSLQFGDSECDAAAAAIAHTDAPAKFYLLI